MTPEPEKDAAAAAPQNDPTEQPMDEIAEEETDNDFASTWQQLNKTETLLADLERRTAQIHAKMDALLSQTE